MRSVAAREIKRRGIGAVDDLLREGPLHVPAAVLGKARALGPAGARWLRSLPDLIRTIEQEWAVTTGPALGGGSAAYVASATTADGAAAILKIHLPGYDSVATEIRVLRIAKGRGYARLLRADEARGVLLLERLGPRLSQLGLPARRQMDIICATLERAWVTMSESPDAAIFPTGADKARWLRAFIAQTWAALDRPCSEQVIDQALAFGVAREHAFDPTRSVLVHGDPHGSNTLAPLDARASSSRTSPGSAPVSPLAIRSGAAPPHAPAATAFKLVDPDGLFAERAYDLAILMRDWSEALLAGDPWRLGQERCAYLSRLTGEEPAAIWQWGFVERVSTGLLLLQTGSEPEGRDCLRVAEAWAQP